MKYGSFIQRLLAALIDLIIMSFIPGFWSEDTGSALSLFAMTIAFAYIVWMNGSFGATVGKMVMRIKIVKENGKKITYSEALVREIASILSLVALGLGLIWMIWDKRKQTWHDKIVHTVVVQS